MLYDVLHKLSVRRLDKNSLSLYTKLTVCLYISYANLFHEWIWLYHQQITLHWHLPHSLLCHRLKIAMGPRVSLEILHMLFCVMIWDIITVSELSPVCQRAFEQLQRMSPDTIVIKFVTEDIMIYSSSPTNVTLNLILLVCSDVFWFHKERNCSDALKTYKAGNWVAC